MALLGRARYFLAFVLMLVTLMPHVTLAAVEPRTGIAFDDKLKKKGTLQKLGVRTKGPILVYAVGLYGANTYVLKMARNVGAEKMSSALADALKPRCKTCETEIGEFKSLVLNALPKGAKKGTELMFGTGGGKLTVTVNGKDYGKVSSKPLATAFGNIYSDKNAVCVMKAVGEAEEEDDTMGLSPTIVALVVTAVTTLFLLIDYFLWKTRIHVSELNLYPIKSCAEQQVTTAHVTERGFEGDRIAQVTDRKGECCTSRDKDKVKLFHVQPTYYPGERLEITAPGLVPGTVELDLGSISTLKSVQVKHIEAPGKLLLEDYGDNVAAFLNKATGIPGCRLTGIGHDYQRNVLVNEAQGDVVPTKTDAPVSLADEAPFLLTSDSSLRDLNRRLQERGKDTVDMRRFRPNIVISGLKPWEEDCLRKIRISGVEFWVWQRCGRCVMTTIDRDTLERNAEPLATLNTFRERDNGMRNFGMHLIPIVNSDKASISVGDTVEILEYDEDRRREWKELFG